MTKDLDNLPENELREMVLYLAFVLRTFGEKYDIWYEDDEGDDEE